MRMRAASFLFSWCGLVPHTCEVRWCVFRSCFRVGMPPHDCVTLSGCARKEQPSAQRPLGTYAILWRCVCPSRSLRVGDQVEADVNSHICSHCFCRGKQKFSTFGSDCTLSFPLVLGVRCRSDVLATSVDVRICQSEVCRACVVKICDVAADAVLSCAAWCFCCADVCVFDTFRISPYALAEACRVVGRLEVSVWLTSVRR